MEDRTARLEEGVAHIQSDVSEMKIDIRRLDAKIDGLRDALTARIDGLRDTLTTKIDGVIESLTEKVDGLKESVTKLAVMIEKQRGVDRVWWLVIAATLLGVMAHGFKWP